MARYEAVESLFRRALAIDETSFGPEHPNVATDLNNLAALLQDTNRLAEAEPLYRRALAIDEASFGPEHPEVATDLNNLAGLLRASHRLAEAEPLFRRASVIMIRSLGPKHPRAIGYTGNFRDLLNTFRKDSATVEREFAAMCAEAGTDAETLLASIRQKYFWIR